MIGNDARTRIAALGTLALVLSSTGPAARADAPRGGTPPLNVAFVLLPSPAMPRGPDVVRAYRAFAPKGPQLRVSAAGPHTDTLALDVSPSGTALIALIPVAVPKGEADEAARFSVSSMGTGWKLPPHRAHLVVTLSDPGHTPPVESLSRFTSVVAAVTQASHAVGVYWGSASATHDPGFVTSVARKPSIVPRIMLWSGVSVAREADGRLSLLSLGMKQLGLPDLLLTAPAGEERDALAMCFDLLGYVAERGTPLPEGDTVGRTEREKLPVHYVPSPLDTTRQVWRVDLK